MISLHIEKWSLQQSYYSWNIGGLLFDFMIIKKNKIIGHIGSGATEQVPCQKDVNKITWQPPMVYQL